MSDQPGRRAPPGWYAEQGKGGYQYWDGQSWAEPMARPAGRLYGGNDQRSSSTWQRTGLALMGAAVALLATGLALPWAESESGDQGLFDGDLPWLVGVGDVADSWLLIVMAAATLWALLVVALTGSGRRIWLATLFSGLAEMGFCVAEGLAMDGDLDLAGARVGLGLFVAFAGGAAASMGGVLLSPGR
ncbi:hypothetical protein [Candidatus Poriferisocius sp.]|uniref:hypothetical protein n=1 Tax=Candidatus Poriferisocius sp. TaxID=3101276 RepID=UPI003B025172